MNYRKFTTEVSFRLAIKLCLQSKIDYMRQAIPLSSAGSTVEHFNLYLKSICLVDLNNTALRNI